jgi:hypothetical protein
MRKSVFPFILILLWPIVLFADTIFLKDGRSIIVEESWEENDQIKARLRGVVVGFFKSDVERVEADPKDRSGNTHTGFQFDIWHSGLTVYEVMEIAERRDIPIVRDGLITISKNFNPDTSRKYAISHNKFYYKNTLLGKPAKIQFQFSLKSRLLYNLSIQWGGPGVSKTEPFFSEVQSMLMQKYGQTFDKKKEVIFYREFYNINANAYAMLQGSSGSVQINYFDKYLKKLAEKEIADLKEVDMQEYMKKDYKKF